MALATLLASAPRLEEMVAEAAGAVEAVTEAAVAEIEGIAAAAGTVENATSATVSATSHASAPRTKIVATVATEPDTSPVIALRAEGTLVEAVEAAVVEAVAAADATAKHASTATRLGIWPATAANREEGPAINVAKVATLAVTARRSNRSEAWILGEACPFPDLASLRARPSLLTTTNHFQARA